MRVIITKGGSESLGNLSGNFWEFLKISDSRAMKETHSQIYAFAGFRVDAAKRLLYGREDEPIALTPKVFETLLYLVQNNQRVIEKDELMREIWADTIVEENNLNKNISILRRILGEKKNEHRFIVTVPGRGYKFVADVVLTEPAAGGFSSEEEKRKKAEKEKNSSDNLEFQFSNFKLQNKTESQIPNFKSQSESETLNLESQDAPEIEGKFAINEKQNAEFQIQKTKIKDRKPNRLRLVSLTVLSILATVGAIAGIHLWRGNGKSADAPVKTVAVLPFKPLVLENRNEALELGMADALINKISSSEEIVVRPLGSVRRYTNLEQDVLQAGRELGVDSVLEGTIQTWGDRIRVSARLVSTSNGKQLWTETFDEKFTDIFAVQDSISNKVLSALTLKFGGEVQKRLTRRGTENVEAYQLYMKGRFHAARLILPEVKKGIEYYNQAIALDPNYALAYVGIAQAYTGFSLSGDIPANDAMPKGKAAALKAIELDANLPEAQVAAGWFSFWYDWNWTEAEKKYQRALELDPNNAAAHYFYAHLNSNLGRHAEALTLARRARELDPLTLIVNSAEGQFLFYAGQSDEAVSRLNKTLELEPNFWHTHLVLSGIYAEKQKFAEATAAADRAAQISGGNSSAVAAKAYALAKSGNLAGAQIVLAELQKLSAEKYVPAYNFAIVYNALGEHQTALDYLEKAYAEKNVLMVFLKVDPKWNNLRGDARFIELMRRMNFQ
ncbi:MAG: winged helix-turn-helix domain-containing protein [Acidobacteria bacterium]|nr:winged helix-turn-helix domain-containing protein [Acidobacteriota bacterium]